MNELTTQSNEKNLHTKLWEGLSCRKAIKAHPHSPSS